MEKNEIYQVKIESYNSEAQGVARIGGYAVFVPYALPGEKWEIKILKVTNSAIWAKGIELLEPSQERMSPDCKYYGKCGGCDCRHMSYEEELHFKLCRVNDALSRIGKQTVKAEIIHPADSVFRYRNKAIYTVEEGSFGFYRERSHDLIAIDDCKIQQELSIKCAKFIASLNDKHIRNVFVRDTVCTIISSKGFDYTEELVAVCPELTGVVLCVNKGRENSILNGSFYTLYGEGDVTEILCNHKFLISPQSFYQINPPQAEKLYGIAVNYAGKGEKAIELYCGAGTISLCLAERFKKVIAAETVPEAIENAKVNAFINGITNVDFICADAGEIDGKAEVVVVDPPRKGMLENAINSVKRINPERIVYVSCNPATLARDIAMFEPEYELVKCEAVDMFPRTCHVESVCLMVRKKI